MKTPNKFSILVWACNLTLVLISVIIIACSYYYTLIPGLTEMKPVPDGAKKYSTKFSHGLLSDHFTFEKVYNKEKGINRENYYYTSARNLYKVPFEDSVMVEVNRLNEDLSLEDSRYAGLVTKRTIVTESAGTLPIRFAALAIPLDREEIKSIAKMNILSFIFYGIYMFIFVWFLRRFVSGLRKPNFFSPENSKYLYITASLVSTAPFLIWGWSAWVRPDLYSEYLIDNNTAINATSSLPTALLVFGVILLVIAWCFDQGVKLQKEQELTI